MANARIRYRPTIRQRAGFLWANLWLNVARYAFRRLKVPHREEPDGLPLRRSVDYPCASYSPRARLDGDWFDCHGDGHYLCPECSHYTEDEPGS